MKHTFLENALSTGETWVKNAGSFLNRHRYLIGGALGGAVIGMAALGGKPAALGAAARPVERIEVPFGAVPGSALSPGGPRPPPLARTGGYGAVVSKVRVVD